MHKLMLLALVVSLLVAPAANALDSGNLTQDDLTLIARNCKNAQRTLQRIQYTDPVARVNRGTAYNNISKLMSALTARAAFNAYSIPQFSTETEAVQRLRSQFAADYTSYEIGLRALISFDCVDKPREFYERLVDVRSKRATVAMRINEIDRHLDAYSANITLLGQLINTKEVGP